MERYAWEADDNNGWQNLEEDKNGNLVTENLMATDVLRTFTKSNASRNLRKGVIRYIVLVLDLSKKMDDVDSFRPNCLGACLEALKVFISDFFERNPLSFLSLVTAQDGKAKVLTELSSSKAKHLKALTKFSTFIDYSLQNSLEACFAILNFIPKYFSREVLVLQAALSSCDPGDIFETIAKLQKDQMRVSFISLSAEVYICRRTAELTKGSYMVVKSKRNLLDTIKQHVNAPALLATAEEAQNLKCSYMLMGFPVVKENMECPRCFSQVGSVELPSSCENCDLSLIDSSHLTKSYHHLMPVEEFKLTSADEVQESCYGCNELTNSSFCCCGCGLVFCEDCNVLIHDTVHVCPGCY